MKKNVLLWIVAVLALAVGVSGCGSNDDNEIVNVDREIQAVSSGEGYEWGETDIRGVFAAGDLVSGPKTVVEAVAFTKKVFLRMEEFLRSETE